MEKYVHVFVLILVLHALNSALANKSSSLSLADECSLLYHFKENMSINKSASSDPRAYPKVASWSLNTSDDARSCCIWDGVECRFGHVIGLDLSNSLLYGPISSNNSLLNLIHLHKLNLADNDFCSSQIPSKIGRLSRLAYLNLSYSVFSGEVPKQISQLRNLVSLDLSINGLKLQSFGFHEATFLRVNSDGVYGLTLHSSDFKNLVQNSSETLRELFLSEVNIDSELPDNLVNSSMLTSLVMSECGLGGEFPTGIFNLQKLQLLDVLGNDLLTGYIPEFHGNSELKHLSIADTKFQGSIPASIGNLTQLNYLDLGDCTFTGTLPASLSNLTQLTLLDLNDNNFTGNLPSLQSFSKLTYLSLSQNSFDKWKLPDWFGNLKKIIRLDLSDINLYGDIQSSFFNLTEIKWLDLSRNQLKGQLPSSLVTLQNLEDFRLIDNNVTVDFYLFLSLKKLQFLSLSGNNITLSVIDNHTNENQPKFTDLDLSSCNLKVFPEFLRFQHHLEYLYLDNNKIEGLIPGWMWNISKETLIIIFLTHNLLVGFEQHSPVAPWFSLQIMDLSHNMLTGEILPSICELVSLWYLDLSFNNITGSIPPCLEKLSNSLLVLNLRRNTLQGTIPRSLEKCESLQMLDLGDNLIEGMFPFWLGALSQLEVLILRFNKFHGIIRIPSNIKVNFPKLHIIDLSYNSFSGDLPDQYFREWSAMKETNANTAYMYWPIQITNKGVMMDYVETINTFVVVDLSSNMFRGKIPESISTLSGLQLLNISNNELSGTIPPSMGNLIKLEALDLSNNKLSGTIPQDLVQLNFLEVLNVSNNNLTGPIPQGKQFNTFSNNSYMGNQALCGFPLSMKCGYSKAPKPPQVSVEEDTESDFPNGVDWAVILIGVAGGLVIGLFCGNYLTTRYSKWFLLTFTK